LVSVSRALANHPAHCPNTGYGFLHPGEREGAAFGGDFLINPQRIGRQSKDQSRGFIFIKRGRGGGVERLLTVIIGQLINAVAKRLRAEVPLGEILSRGRESMQGNEMTSASARPASGMR
jgi:hypothetical protein